MITIIQISREEVLSLQSAKNLIESIYKKNEFMSFESDFKALEWYNSKFGDDDRINIKNNHAEVMLFATQTITGFEQEANAVKTLNRYINHLWADMEE